MNRVQLTKNLFLDEYIPKELYLKFSSKPHILFGLLDQRLIRADQMLADVFGTVLINTWWSGGDRNWSGIRLAGSPYFSETSQHSFGRASDKLFKKYTAEEVRQYIKVHWQTLGITCIEANVDWVHSDCRALLDPTKLLIVTP